MLTAQAQSLNEVSVPLRAFTTQVAQQAPPAVNHLQHAAARRKVFAVLLEVLGQLGDSPRKQRHLHLRGPHVILVSAMFADDLFLGLWCQWHSTIQYSFLSF